MEMIMQLSPSDTCIFCKKAVIDELNLGPLYKYKDIITHHHCLFLSPNLIQNAPTDEAGIFGFLEKDIIKESRRAAKLTCRYCKKKGAALGCTEKKCSVKFHLPCGLKNGSLHQYFNEFKSFCSSHRPVQDMATNLQSEKTCLICYGKINTTSSHETLVSTCCSKDGIFHRSCIQTMALSAGRYYFRCPLCNSEEVFLDEMQRMGIFIPTRDAAWEETNEYEDLLERRNTCDLKNCECPTGRNTDIEGSEWELFLCTYCGSQGAHLRCGKLEPKQPVFICAICS